MEYYLILRLLKFTAIILWGAGTLSLLSTRSQYRAIRDLYVLVLPGFILSWLVGWLMMKHLGQTMKEMWISNAMLFSLLSVLGSFFAAFFQKGQKTSMLLSSVGLMTALAAMIFRQNEGALIGIGLAAVFGVVLGLLFQREKKEEFEISKPLIQNGFKYVAWGEGTTVLTLFLLYMPLKYAAGINIDFGTGMIGWAHGVFVIVYIMSLSATKIALKWTWMQWFLGGVLSFLPFGTFWFEHRIFATEVSKS